MRKRLILVIIISITILLTGCENKRDLKNLSENINKIELKGDLVTYEAYYHNVIEYEKEKDNWLEKDRKLFAEYRGTIRIGINLSDVKIDIEGNEIKVFIPKAKIIGEPNVEEESFKAENFIESKDGIFKNKLTIEDSNKAFNEAQKNMKKIAEQDEKLFDISQTRAKAIIEETIKEFTGLSEKDYKINWELGQ